MDIWNTVVYLAHFPEAASENHGNPIEPVLYLPAKVDVLHGQGDLK